jgi:hypothetical protein
VVRFFRNMAALAAATQPVCHLNTGPQSQKVGLVSITNVFWGVLRP